MAEEKKKRGRPRKKTPLIEIPEEIEKIVNEVAELEKKANKGKKTELEEKKEEEIKEVLELEEIKKEVQEAHRSEWDYDSEHTPDFFDATKSYQLTGYKPIDENNGLDFDPKWFLETRENFLRTGHYTQYPRNTKAYADFWDELYKRCLDGMTSHGYTITGDHYFFLNFYQLMDLTSAKKAGSSRMYDFPKFFVGQYLFFHYVELARRLRVNAVLMKARGIGYSEINASILANSYNCRKNSINVLAAQLENYVAKTLDKVWAALSFLNNYTDGGFFKLRQVSDTATKKRASVKKIVNGQQIETGWMSQIEGIVADKPNKIRGDRTDLLVYEELGSWPNSKKAFIQGDALTGIQGARFGIKLGGGTGGDSGPSLEGLRDMYYHPNVYDILKYKHNYSLTGELVMTAYFIPSFTIVNREDCTDDRGWTNPNKGKAYYDSERAKKAEDPKALITYSAEYCYNAEEAFSLEGENNFDKVIIAEQLAAIRLLKTAPPIEHGRLSYIYRNGEHRPENICGFKWEEMSGGKIHILEHPVWSDEYKRQMRGQEIADYAEMNNLYIAGVDSIDIGLEDTSENTDNPSNFCITIMRRQLGSQDPVIVAYYKDRPNHIREAYKIAMCLVLYYNAIINIEATRMNFFSWAREHKYYKYFMMRPRATYPDPNKIGKRTPGTPATPNIIAHLLLLIAAYIEDYGLHIWFEEMLDELNRYSYENKTHFDIVASLGMLMLADEELGEVVASKNIKPENLEVWEFASYYIDDNGYKRYGFNPNTIRRKQDIIITDNFFNYSGPRTSTPLTWDDF